jgi:predicted O-methyltransferase YrrM
MPYIGRLRRQIGEMLRREGRYPAGHYYSPIPNSDDIARHIAQQASKHAELCPEIQFRQDAQFSQLQDYSRYYDELPFTEARQADFRYYYGQGWFRYADAIFLYCHLRETQPQRIIEVGSGFSSAVILDTVEHFLPYTPDIVFVEPNPDRLLEILKPEDQQSVQLIQDQVQDVPFHVFDSLQANDLLFVDSSHVVKAGSDLYYLFFDVLPRLKKGVIVHFHDVFYPFDYRTDWHLDGWYWNEAYFLRAFLAYNSEWRIRFFNSYIGGRYHEYLLRKMPLCVNDTGGSLYIERT